MEPSPEIEVSGFLDPSSPSGEDFCVLCLSAPARYTCPRCNAPYCSLSCYRGGRHRGCSEGFYREEVLRGLQEAGGGLKGDIEGILKRVRESQLRAEEEQGPSEDSDDRDEELCVEEGAGQEEEGLEAECPLDEESLDPQTLWQTLTLEEQQDFERLLESGGLGALLQPWQPWWESHEGTLLVQEVRQMHEELLPHNVATTTALKQRSAEGPLEQKEGVNLPKLRGDEGLVGSTKTTDVMIAKGSKLAMHQGGQALHQKDSVLKHYGVQTQQVVTPGITISGGHEGRKNHGKTNTVASSKNRPAGGDVVRRRQEKPGIEVTVIARHDIDQKKRGAGLEKRHGDADKLSGPKAALNKRPVETEREVNDVKTGAETVAFSKEALTGGMNKIESTVNLKGPELITVVNSKRCQTAVINALTEHCGSGTLSPPTQQNVGSTLAELEQTAVLLQQSQTQGILANEENTNLTERVVPNQDLSGMLQSTSQTPVPHVRSAISPLSSLTSNPSPLVRFNLVNILYAYAFSLKLYNGDLGEDFLQQEFCDTVLAVSGALSSTRVFDSTAEALQAGIQVVLTMGSKGDPEGAALAVGHILLGVSHGGRKMYTLAALSHLADILLKARKLAQKEKKQFIFKAKKKCDFLLSWANENEDSLTLLSVEVQSEYKRYVTSLKEVELVTRELEKSWGGNKPPQKKVLIYELD